MLIWKDFVEHRLDGTRADHRARWLMQRASKIPPQRTGTSSGEKKLNNLYVPVCVLTDRIISPGRKGWTRSHFQWGANGGTPRSVGRVHDQVCGHKNTNTLDKADFQNLTEKTSRPCLAGAGIAHAAQNETKCIHFHPRTAKWSENNCLGFF